MLVEFVTARHPLLLRRAYLLTGDHGAAEDLVQDSLAKLWLAWSRHPIDNPDAYRRRTMAHAAISRWRRRKPWDRVASAGVEPAAPDHSPGVDEHDQLWRALLTLAPRQRAVLVLRYYEDLSEPEICDALGIAPGTVRSQAAKARAQLRSILEETQGATL